ncbi:hypothetical protein BV25DRAFT_231872 [Artomyces pyxidatus]|uniref:Uncharacterized protein n=1 Tax=Artomyces pyxidatus TaxID=48021 RepID=A0ACB8SG61_9AGAM|nr:hypothetical protein BV25DRAFT_231872 [Artomyces pyxidatus]
MGPTYRARHNRSATRFSGSIDFPRGQHRVGPDPLPQPDVHTRNDAHAAVDQAIHAGSLEAVSGAGRKGSPTCLHGEPRSPPIYMPAKTGSRAGCAGLGMTSHGTCPSGSPLGRWPWSSTPRTTSVSARRSSPGWWTLSLQASYDPGGRHARALAPARQHPLIGAPSRHAGAHSRRDALLPHRRQHGHAVGALPRAQRGAHCNSLPPR